MNDPVQVQIKIEWQSTPVAVIFQSPEPLPWWKAPVRVCAECRLEEDHPALRGMPVTSNGLCWYCAQLASLQAEHRKPPMPADVPLPSTVLAGMLNGIAWTLVVAIPWLAITVATHWSVVCFAVWLAAYSWLFHSRRRPGEQR